MKTFNGFKPPPDFLESQPLYCAPCSNETHHDASSSDDDNAFPVEVRSKLQLKHSWKSPHHALVIQSLLKPLPAVTKVIVDLELDCIYVDHTGDTAELVYALQQGGYPVKLAATHEITDQDELMYRDANAQSNARSVLFVKGICCASEVPSVRKIVKTLPGVEALQINIAMKRVYVQHDTSLSAKEIAERLTKSGFPAQVLRDGALLQNDPVGHTSIGRSTLHTQAVLHNQDVQKIQRKLMTLDGVHRIGVNVIESVVYVEHDVRSVAPSDLVPALLPEYPASLVQDAEADIRMRTTALLNQPRSKYVESTLHVSNLSLSHLSILNKAIAQNYIRAQIRAVHPHTTSRTVKVEHNPQLCRMDTLCSTLAQYGLDCSIVVDGAVEGLLLPLVERDDALNENEQAALSAWEGSTLHWNVVLSGIFWVVSMVSLFTFNDLKYAGLLSVVFGLPPVMKKAWRTLKRREFDANCMMVTAALGALALGEFDEAASVSFLFSVSEYLESRATDKARKALSDIVQLRPEHANVIHPETNELVVVPADKVPVNTLISVRTGDKIAADGIVVEGSSTVDESSLTGESVPVQKKAGDTVMGGSINIGAIRLVVRTTTSVEDSAVSRLIRLVEEAQANRSATEKMVDKFARAYTPAIVLLAALMCTVPWLFGPDTGRQWTLNGLIVIVIACPCALTISTPVTYSAALAATAKRGIVIKGGASLEALGSVETVVLDKTGTITEGKFVLSHLQEIGKKRSREQVLALLALMEAPSSHPLSVTLVKAARQEGITLPKGLEIKEHTTLKGEGVTATAGDKQIYVGNRRLFQRLGMYAELPQAYQGLSEEWESLGGTVGFIGVEGEGIIGTYCMIDRVRDEAKDVVCDLRFGGIQVLMLTGDSQGAALAVAKQIGLPAEAVHAQLLPEDKLHFVGGLKHPESSNSYGLFRRKPQIMFVGDGTNDGPALAVADVGVSMGEGAALALEMSDITLMDSNLTKLQYSIRMGGQVVTTIQENIIMSLSCKVLVVVLTFFGYMTLLFAIASDVGVMLLVTLNGMRLLPGEVDDAPLKKTKIGASGNYNELSLGSESSPTGVAEINSEIV